MFNLVAAVGAFLFLHLVISGTPLRDVLVARVGAKTYLISFSVASAVALVWLCFAFADARDDAWNITYWGVSPTGRYAQLALQLVAMLFILPGRATVPNPTGVMQERSLSRANIVSGMLRITRHPFLWGVAIWAFGHLLANGKPASLILFGAFLLLTLVGTVSIDAKRARALGVKWEAFAKQTSNIPFAAIVAGHQRLSLREIGWWRIALGFGAWVGLTFGHQAIFGVPAI